MLDRNKYPLWLKMLAAFVFLFLAILVLSVLFKKGSNIVALISCSLLVLDRIFILISDVKEMNDDYNDTTK